MARSDLLLVAPPGNPVAEATAAGTSTAFGIGSADAPAVASSAGVATAVGLPRVAGLSTGSGSAVAAAAVQSPATASAAGISGVSSAGSSQSRGAAAAAGGAIVDGRSGGPSVGLASAGAVATAVGAAQKRASAAAAGIAAASAASSSIVTLPHGTGAGTSAAVAVGRALVVTTASSSAYATAVSIGVAIRPAKPLVVDIRERREALAVGVIVEMFELDATNIGGEIYRFCNAAMQNQLISFAGESYFPTQFESEGWAVGSSGPIPRPLIRMNSTVSLLTGCADLDDFRGARLRRIRTLNEYLDDGATPNPSQRFPDELYVVSNITNKDLIFVEFELMALIDQEGKRIPARQAFRTRCPWIYRRYVGGGDFDYTNATCPYAGQIYLTIKDEVTLDPAKDLCSKRLSACKTRFGPNAVLPYGGFPGMVRV